MAFAKLWAPPHTKIVDRRAQRDDDLRRASRYEMRIAMSFEVAGRQVDATSRNIGLGGMFIETTEAAPFGASVTVHLPLPGFRAPVAIQATVRWTLPDGMGVQFGSMGARETHALMQLIYAG
jgi:type IV pilus assembly protein PilZ